jgi:hypothetical protein
MPRAKRLKKVTLEELSELRGGECTVTVYPEQQAYNPGRIMQMFGAQPREYRPRMLGISGDSCYDDYLLHREQKDNGGTLQTGAVVLSKDARAQYVPARARFRSGQ